MDIWSWLNNMTIKQSPLFGVIRERQSPGGGAPRPIGGGAPRPGGYCVGAPAILAPAAAAATVPLPCGVMTCTHTQKVTTWSCTHTVCQQILKLLPWLPVVKAHPLLWQAQPNQLEPEALVPLQERHDLQHDPLLDRQPRLPMALVQYQSNEISEVNNPRQKKSSERAVDVVGTHIFRRWTLHCHGHQVFSPQQNQTQNPALLTFWLLWVFRPGDTGQWQMYLCKWTYSIVKTNLVILLSSIIFILHYFHI